MVDMDLKAAKTDLEAVKTASKKSLKIEKRAVELARQRLKVSNLPYFRAKHRTDAYRTFAMLIT